MEDGVDQHLSRRQRSIPIPEAQRSPRGEVPAGARTPEPDRMRVSPEVRGVGPRPVERGDGLQGGDRVGRSWTSGVER